MGRTNAEAEAPILWPPDTKSWLIRKDPDAGKDWRQEDKRTTEGETVGWHHWLNGHEFEQAPRNSDGQGSVACCSPWSHKESDTTQRLNNKNVWKWCLWVLDQKRWNVISDWLEFLIVGLLVSDSRCEVKCQKSLGVTQRRDSKETGFGVAFSSAPSTGLGISGFNDAYWRRGWTGLASPLIPVSRISSLSTIALTSSSTSCVTQRQQSTPTHPSKMGLGLGVCLLLLSGLASQSLTLSTLPSPLPQWL